ncbi:MAG: hypothetical protein CMF96_01295 [Candidatus Marinimicrobia bacterium]|nr:hypothetical protein [Candidatus Neomarinimicrobiota bacterium]|tara:strand:- start:12288 stop:13121 length:834 start_codon:yes stop_codon:yes gene_type:complete
MKNLFNLYFLFNLVFGSGFIESPQNSINLARWNGGSASSNIYHQLNPAALPIFNVVSFSNIQIPGDISLNSIFISQNFKNYLIKINTTVIDYGRLEDFVTNKNFNANDLKVDLSIKSTFEEILSLGLQIGYLNRNIENFSKSILVTKFGLRTQLLEKRLGIGFVLNHSFDDEDKIYSLIGIFYKPIYFPGELSIDIRGVKQSEIIFSIILNINSYFDFSLGFTNDKLKYHTGSTIENIYSGLGLGFNLNLKSYNLAYGIRNIGQYGVMNGITLSFNL